MKKNQTRRALLMSALSLLLCVSMLVGTTFAWFTDKVESGVNTIAAGNLDVELYHADEGTADFTKVGNTTVLFDDVTPNLWEPGALAYENFKIKNEGTLALKYNMNLNVAEESVVNGNKLSDVIWVGINADGAFEATTREGMISEADSWTKLSEFSLNAHGDLLTAGEEKVFGLVLYWQPNANEIDNLYNVKGEALNLKLGVNLFATQQIKEEDSFGKDYDEDAGWNGIIPTAMPDSLVLEFADEARDGGKVIVKDDDAFVYLNNLVDYFKANATQNPYNHYYYNMNWSVELEADINLMNIPIDSIQTGFFGGGFDGKGHTISNVVVKNGQTALFNSKVYPIKNLTVENIVVNAPEATRVAAVLDMGGLENVHVVNANVIGGKYVGGLAGQGSNFINCSIKNSVIVGTDKTVGGLVGYCSGDPDQASATGNVVENVTVTGAYNVGGMFGQAQNVIVDGNTVKNVTVISTKALPAGASSNEVRTAEVAARSAFANTTIGTNTVENVTCGIEVYGLTLIPNGSASKIIVNDKEGFLNLTKLSADWRELFTDGNGNEWSNYANGAGADYYYGGYWTISLEADIDLNNATIAPITINHPVSAGDPTFDGNNHTIKNAKIVADAAAENMTGLFNVSYEAFKNLKLDNIHVTGSNVGNSSAGILAGSCHGRIDNITITNSSVTGGKYTGGVVGYGYTDISNCTLTNVTVKGGYKLGGIIGYICAGTGDTHNVTGNTLTDCTVDGIGGGVFAGGKTEYVIGQVVGNYNCNGTCNNNTITGMTSSVTDAIGKIEAGKTVTQ